MADVIFSHNSGRWRVVFRRIDAAFTSDSIYGDPDHAASTHWVYAVERRRLFLWRQVADGIRADRRDAILTCCELASR